MTTNTTTPVNIPTDPEAYARWLAGRIRSTAGRIRSLSPEAAGMDSEHRAALAEAANDLLAALALDAQ